MKRILALLMSICLVFSLALPAMAARVKDVIEERQAKIVTLQTPEDFLGFAEKCRLDSYSRDLQVELKADIDLTGTDFTGIPIFCGTFLGNDHTISGLNLTVEGSNQGLFRYLSETALVQDLQVRGNVAPWGKPICCGRHCGPEQWPGGAVQLHGHRGRCPAAGRHCRCEYGHRHHRKL